MKIANEDELNREIDYAIQNNAVALDEMMSRLQAAKTNSFIFILGIIFNISLVIFSPFIVVIFISYQLSVVYSVLLISIIILFNWLIMWPIMKKFSLHRKLKNECNSIIAALLSKIFDIPIQQFTNEVHGKGIRESFNNSELITKQVSVFTSGVQFVLDKTCPGSFSYISFQAGYNKSNLFRFEGFIANLKLPKTLSGKTFVYPEADKYNFTHETLVSNVLGDSDAKGTFLEWNEFEDYFHVATNNELEARYILTPNFMEFLYSWWRQNKDNEDWVEKFVIPGNTRMSFKEDNLYILYPVYDLESHWAYLLNWPGKENLRRYVHTIAKPIWRSLLLSEKLYK